jgi:hypothetical protein
MRTGFITFLSPPRAKTYYVYTPLRHYFSVILALAKFVSIGSEVDACPI